MEFIIIFNLLKRFLYFSRVREKCPKKWMKCPIKKSQNGLKGLRGLQGDFKVTSKTSCLVVGLKTILSSLRRIGPVTPWSMSF